MKSEIINMITLSCSFLALFGLAEILYHYFTVKVETTRKLVHCGTGLITLMFPLLLENHWSVLFLSSSFAILLLASLYFKLLPSINAINRKSIGSLAYPIAVYCCYLAYEFINHGVGESDKQLIYFYLPMLILAVSDPIAALTGKKWPFGIYYIGVDSKTLMGTGMFFASSATISLVGLYYLNPGISIVTILLQACIISGVAAVTEAVSVKGFDNLTIPFSVLICLLILLEPISSTNTLVALLY